MCSYSRTYTLLWFQRSTLINLESLVILDMWFVTRLCNSAHMIRFNVLHGTTRMTLCAHLSLAIIMINWPDLLLRQ